MKRWAPLRSRKPLRRRTPLRARGKTRYRLRERDMNYMGWVRRQPCIVRELPPSGFLTVPELNPHTTPCYGRVEADHAGDRAFGQKADDATCIPMCRGHHRERTDHAGTFSPLTRDELRAWRIAAIERTQAAWRNR